MDNLQEAFKKINIACPLVFNESLSLHTSFGIGGRAAVFARPRTVPEVKEIFSLCLEKQFPHRILGQGANVLVADKGLDAVVISLEDFAGLEIDGTLLSALSGTPLNTVVEKALDLSLQGLDSFYKMPGSVGGSIWMNARCYDASLADRLEQVDILDDTVNITRMTVNKHEFSYKHSPFQGRDLVILAGAFRLENGDRERIKTRMDEIYADRIKKGHFLYPCAGSVFKNDRSFGLPSGRIIDNLGLKGLRMGGAQVLPQHANIIVNTGKASAEDVLSLIEYIKRKVFECYGFKLEEEIIFWDQMGK